MVFSLGPAEDRTRWPDPPHELIQSRLFDFHESARPLRRVIGWIFALGKFRRRAGCMTSLTSSVAIEREKRSRLPQGDARFCGACHRARQKPGPGGSIRAAA